MICRTKLSKEMGYAAAADREGVVDRSLDDMSIARTQCYSPLERQREKEGRMEKENRSCERPSLEKKGISNNQHNHRGIEERRNQMGRITGV